MKIRNLRPGMENVDLKVRLVRLDDPRNVTTYTGIEHVLVEGEVEDTSGVAALTVWNDAIDQLDGVEIGSTVELRGCFITSFKGVIHVNVGRGSEIIKSCQKER